MGDAVITYETLFEILRRERNREEIQKVDDTFMQDIAHYFEQKQIHSATKEQNIFSLSEREKTERQILNAKRLLKEIYDRREKKIMLMALNKAKTNSSLINTANILPFEKELYQELLKTLLTARTHTLLPILRGTITSPSEDTAKKSSDKDTITTPEQIKSEQFNETDDMTEKNNSERAFEPKVLKAEPIDAVSVHALEDETNERKKVRFLESVPKFIGPNLEMYGPYNERDEAELPSQIASILITKKRAEDLTKV